MGHLRDNTHRPQGGISVSPPCCHESFSAPSRPSNAHLVPTIVCGVTCVASRFNIFGRGSATVLTIECWNTALQVALRPRHPQNLSFEITFHLCLGGSIVCSPRTFQQRWFSRREYEDFKCRSSVDCGGLFQRYRPALSGRGVPDPSPVLRYFGGLLDGLFTVRC